MRGNLEAVGPRIMLLGAPKRPSTLQANIDGGGGHVHKQITSSDNMSRRMFIENKLPDVN